MRLRRPGRATLRAWLLNLAVAAAILLGGHLWQTRHVPAGSAPEFSAAAVSVQPGAVLSLEQWRAAHPGQPVALNFWAEWCPICRIEQGNVTRMTGRWPVLTVATRSGDVPAVRQELARRGLAWPTVIDPHGQIAQRYGVSALPAFIVLDADGVI